MKSIFTFTLLISTFFGFTQNTNGFKFKIIGNNYSDETIIRLHTSATSHYDSNYDAYKLFSPNPSVPSIYTKIDNGSELSINSLPEYSKDTSITIYTNIPTSGSYIIETTKIFPSSSNYKFSYTHISSSSHFTLLNDTTIAFNFNANQDSPEFTFNISTEATSTVINETCLNNNDGEISIKNTGNTNWNFELYNNNSLVASRAVNSSSDTISQLSYGVYTCYVFSQGIIDTLNLTVNPGINLVADFDLSNDTVYLNEGGFVNTLNFSQNAQNYSWDFGDGNTYNSYSPSNTYNSIGTFEVMLSATNNLCNKSLKKVIVVEQYRNITTNINESDFTTKLIKQSNNRFTINTDQISGIKHLNVYNLKGQLIKSESFGGQSHETDLTSVSSQLYIIKVICNNKALLTEKVWIN